MRPGRPAAVGRRPTPRPSGRARKAATPPEARGSGPRGPPGRRWSGAVPESVWSHGDSEAARRIRVGAAAAARPLCQAASSLGFMPGAWAALGAARARRRPGGAAAQPAAYSHVPFCGLPAGAAAYSIPVMAGAGVVCQKL